MWQHRRTNTRLCHTRLCDTWLCDNYVIPGYVTTMSYLVRGRVRLQKLVALALGEDT
jgi:hypothetical protein